MDALLYRYARTENLPFRMFPACKLPNKNNKNNHTCTCLLRGRYDICYGIEGNLTRSSQGVTRSYVTGYAGGRYIEYQVVQSNRSIGNTILNLKYAYIYNIYMCLMVILCIVLPGMEIEMVIY